LIGHRQETTEFHFGLALPGWIATSTKKTSTKAKTNSTALTIIVPHLCLARTPKLPPTTRPTNPNAARKRLEENVALMDDSRSLLGSPYVTRRNSGLEQIDITASKNGTMYFKKVK
jgi:hypothetical protein